ncbi:MAG: DNA-formamidopyrimidine glycosylase [Chloroflexi bacterium]|nr:DNA-formamidopyrimidine glycosylase [Chloroflexota bacterium]
MPELPEVETLVRDLRPHVIGRRILRAEVHWARTIATPNAREFARAIRGQTIAGLTRRGKFLVFRLRKGASSRVRTQYLLVHLRMTGGFRIDDPRRAPRDRYMHVILRFDDGRELRFRDARKFGRMWLVDEPTRVTGKLGPEPLEVSESEFAARLDKRRGHLKPLLLDQTFLAGLGNIYVDESLWYARLHPLRAAETLTRAERGRLYRAIQRVLSRAIALGGTSIDVMYKRVNGASGEFQDSLRAFDREKRPCRRCGTAIVKTVVGQRGTHYCPTCQRV